MPLCTDEKVKFHEILAPYRGSDDMRGRIKMQIPWLRTKRRLLTLHRILLLTVRDMSPKGYQ